jgi:hypothetical protein
MRFRAADGAPQRMDWAAAVDYGRDRAPDRYVGFGENS